MAILILSLSSSTCFFLLLTQLFFFHAHSITHWQDIHVLKQFKNGLAPDSLSPGSCLSTWDFSLDPCDNLFTDKFTCGFRCDVVTPDNASRVTELALDQAGYSGSLTSSTYWNLPYLQTLDLSNNLFTGPIPDSFANLTRLQRLSLSHNSLSGSLPSSLASLLNLQEIYLDGNQINGTIPSTFSGLRDLKRLELQGNNLTGEFPDLSQLANLTSLDVSDNAVTGELPPNFPPSLFQITMRNNRLQGNIPEALATKLPYLQVLDLSHNELAGSVPASLFAHPSLQQLILSNNSLGSVESPWLAGVRSELIEIDLSDNEIEGFLPGFMGIMPRLSALSLENNKISGMIPVEYAVKAVGAVGEVAGFERLLLGGNYLFGGIPGALLDLKPGRVMVDLGDNCLYRCPVSFFFCQGGQQKPLMECKKLP